MFDERINRFITTKSTTLQLEHSLVSLSKWESKWKTYYLNNDKLTNEMSIDYVRCMTLTQCVDPKVYDYLTEEDMKKIREYIDDPMTATTFTKSNAPARRQIVTAEIIYYWMVAQQIPFDPCQKWHLNRLLTLIRVCDEKNSPKKKMSKREAMSRQRSLNAARRAKYNTSG
jgi:hypothetical protein